VLDGRQKSVQSQRATIPVPRRHPPGVVCEVPNPDELHGPGTAALSQENDTMFHVPPLEPELSDIVPARVAASLQAGFERAYRDARRDKVRSVRERKRREELEPTRPKRADGR